jgi:hypothetical protein
MDTILLDLDVHNMNALVLEPAFNYDNIYQRNLNIYKFVTGVTTYQMTHLSRPTNVLQPKAGCNDWLPTVNFSLRPWEIQSVDYELMGEQCPDEFDKGCYRNLKTSSDEVKRLGAKVDAIEMAMAMQTRKALVDSIYKIAWFGQTNFAAAAAAGAYDLSQMPIREKNKLIAMLQHQNGWWSEIKARVAMPNTASSRFGRVRYLDTNDGTPDGNATDPGNIADYLRNMRMVADPILQFWNLDQEMGEWPIYLLQKGLFDALIRYYQSLGTELANRLIINGITNPRATTFDGYPVLMMPEWDMFDFETGRINPATGYSKTQRALFTAAENLCGIVHGKTLQGRPQSSLAIEEKPGLDAKGKKLMYGCMGIGYGIAQPVLMVAGYNSSDTYA